MPIDDIRNSSLTHKALDFPAISSVDTFSTQNEYSLSLSGRSSFHPDNNITATSARTANYNSTTGYGLINAAAAVARAAGQTTFADVPTLGGNNWGADLVKAPAAWAQGYTGKGVVIAVLDTGVDYNHADLKNNIWTNPGEIPGNGIDDDGNGYIDDVQGWNFINSNNNVLDGNGHGTHVAGTIAGENNGSGITGIAYDAQIMPVKVLDDVGSGSYNAVADGIYYAVNNGANVINLSLGGLFPNSILETAIEYASNQGAMVVMAAGNNGYPFPGYPANYANNWGLAVGAVDRNNNMANFSNRAGINSPYYVTAPGVNVYSSIPDNKYAIYSGTSMATPHVAGVVALMLSANPNLTNAEIRQIIIETAGNSTPVATSSLTASTINISSVVTQAIAEIVSKSTSTSTTSFELAVIPVIDSNIVTSNFSSESTSLPTNQGILSFRQAPLMQFRDYDSPLSSNTTSNIIAFDDDKNEPEAPPDFTDIEQILGQFQKQIDEMMRFFPGF